jgi:hypothetical protein
VATGPAGDTTCIPLETTPETTLKVEKNWKKKEIKKSEINQVRGKHKPAIHPL